MGLSIKKLNLGKINKNLNNPDRIIFISIVMDCEHTNTLAYSLQTLQDALHSKGIAIMF